MLRRGSDLEYCSAGVVDAGTSSLLKDLDRCGGLATLHLSSSTVLQQISYHILYLSECIMLMKSEVT